MQFLLSVNNKFAVCVIKSFSSTPLTAETTELVDGRWMTKTIEKVGKM